MCMGVKISDLPVITLPLNGAEKLPIVQSGATKVSDLSSFLNFLSGAFLNDVELQALSGSWQEGYTTTNALSSNWQTVYTTVCAQSAIWDVGNIEIEEASAIIGLSMFL